jgi:hypothetical protein
VSRENSILLSVPQAKKVWETLVTNTEKYATSGFESEFKTLKALQSKLILSFLKWVKIETKTTTVQKFNQLML